MNWGAAEGAVRFVCPEGKTVLIWALDRLHATGTVGNARVDAAIRKGIRDARESILENNSQERMKKRRRGKRSRKLKQTGKREVMQP